MTNPENQKQCMAELAAAMSDWPQATISVRSLRISPWLAMSLLQKSIRRGEAAFALSAAATLLSSAPDKLWRRLRVAAFEDIGVADLEAVSLALAGTSSKRTRMALGGNWRVASFLAMRLANAKKCRSADDLLMTLLDHPDYQHDRLKLTFQTTSDLMKTATGNDDIVTRAIALCYALGTDRWNPNSLRHRKRHPAYCFSQMLDKGFPHCVLELAQRGFNGVREPLPVLMSLLSRECPGPTHHSCETDEFPETVMVGEVPGWAVDQYAREGKEALRRFLAGKTATALWIRRNIHPRQQLRFLGGIVFRAEGGLLKDRIRWSLGDRLRHQMNIEANGCGVADAAEPLALMKNDFSALNEERKNVR